MHWKETNNKTIMAKGKTKFTKDEIDKLKSLIAQLEAADSTKQKGVRAKLRNIGLYWREVGQGMPYTVANLEKLVNSGVLKIDELNSSGILATDNLTPLTTQSKWKGSQVSGGSSGKRTSSDEYYVIDLCDEVLGEKAERQAKFDFLKGDSGKCLPVDAYYPKKKLVIEYYERQHTESVKLFDKRMTVSGVTRGEQRRIYDERRMAELPKHGIDVQVISYSDFGTHKKLQRNREADLKIVKKLLEKYTSKN